ncbi:MAG: S1C family serine protease [candidate division KSB1 bacterium]|nr:S1C family serine protease [candidate division KSB1 bacterium]
MRDGEDCAGCTRRGFSGMVLVTACVFLGLSLGPVGTSAQPSGILEKLERDISYIVEAVRPCVVTVTGHRSQKAAQASPVRPSLFSFLHREEAEGLDSSEVVQLNVVGSGLVYDTLGHVVTRSTVVVGAEKIWVSFTDGHQEEAKYVGCDVQTGIAVIRVRSRQRVSAVISENPLRPGAWVTIVGNSLGVTPSVSLGLVNGIRPDGLVQVSAALNPGLTGSPAFDSQGRLVGILTAGVAAGGEGETAFGGPLSGTALLCPVHIVRPAVEMILSRALDTRGWVGLTVERQEAPVRGVRVVEVAPSSPAQLAGLRPGDVIVRVGPDRTQGIPELLRHLSDARPGEVLDFTVLRGGRTVRALVEVTERPADGDFHVEVESGCGPVIPVQSAANSGESLSSREGPRGSTSDLEVRVRRLEREIQRLKARVK